MAASGPFSTADTKSCPWWVQVTSGGRRFGSVSVSAQRVTPSQSGLYVVEMSDPPVVAYKGGVPGLKATAPKKGQKIDPTSSEVVAYASYLNAQHGRALGQVGGRKVYDYVYSFNGFAAALSVDQANKLVGTDGEPVQLRG